MSTATPAKAADADADVNKTATTVDDEEDKMDATAVGEAGDEHLADGAKEEKHPDFAISNFARLKAAEAAKRIEKDGMPDIWLWGRALNSTEGMGTITIEDLHREDLTNPFLYVAMQNASQVNITHHLRPIGDDNLWDSNILNTIRMTLHYKTDMSSLHMVRNFLIFIRTPGRKLLIKRSVRTKRNAKNEIYRQQMEMKGTMIDIPLPMRSLIVRGVPKGCDLKTVLDALPNVTESMLEKHELRDDARNHPCALLCFKSADDAIRVHMAATAVKFTADQAHATPVYLQAAGVFYESLLHVYEQDTTKTKRAYAYAMKYTDFKAPFVFENTKSTLATENKTGKGGKRNAPVTTGKTRYEEEGMTPTAAKKAKKIQPVAQQSTKKTPKNTQQMSTPKQKQAQTPATGVVRSAREARAAAAATQPKQQTGRNAMSEQRPMQRARMSDMGPQLRRRDGTSFKQQSASGRMDGGRHQQSQQLFGRRSFNTGGGLQPMLNTTAFSRAYDVPPARSFDESLALQQRILEQQNMINALQQRVDQQSASSRLMPSNVLGGIGGGGMAGGWGGPSADVYASAPATTFPSRTRLGSSYGATGGLQRYGGNSRF